MEQGRSQTRRPSMNLSKLRALVLMMALPLVACGESPAIDFNDWQPDFSEDDSGSPGKGGAAGAAGSAGAAGAAGEHAGAFIALEFAPGAKSYVQVDSFPLPHDFTIEAWIKPTAVNNDTIIFAKDKAGQPANQFRLGLTAAQRLYFIMSDGSGADGGLWTTSTSYRLITPSAVPSGTWSHVAVTRHGLKLDLVVNGAVASTHNLTTDVVPGGSLPLRIGGRVASDGQGAANGFVGVIDEVRVFGEARTAAQIQADRTHLLEPGEQQWASLAGYWRFDELSGPVASDSAAGHNGTLVNNPARVWSDAF